MMTWFWFSAFLLSVAATGFVLLPLYVKPMLKNRNVPERDLVNIALYKERLADLNTQTGDQIASEELAQLQTELQKNLLDDTREAAIPVTVNADIPAPIEAVRLALVLGVLVPMFAVLAYADFGLSWGSMADVEIAEEISAGDPHDTASMRVTVEKLAKRLEGQADNHEGRFMLAQSYMNLSEYEKAAETFAVLVDNFSGDASLASYYAESLFLADARKITPRVSVAIDKALTLNPHELNMLEIKGMDAFQRGDLAASMKFFTTALPVAEGQRADLIRGVMARIENQMQAPGQSARKKEEQGDGSSPDGGRSLQVLVELADSVKVAPDSSVFVFVKAVGGPPMPLAVQKMNVSLLPTLVKLDESMAMMPGMGLANFDQVQVVARISSAGIAEVQADDYEARSGNIDMTDTTSVIKIVISKKIRDQ